MFYIHPIWNISKESVIIVIGEVIDPVIFEKEIDAIDNLDVEMSS